MHRRIGTVHEVGDVDDDVDFDVSEMRAGALTCRQPRRFVSRDPSSRPDRATLSLRSQSDRERSESEADAPKEPTEGSSSARILPTEGAAAFQSTPERS